MTIHVTAEMIAAGKAGDCHLCPIALAIKEATRASWVHVSGHTAYSDRPGLAPLPESAKRFIKRFDRGEPVEPFSFELNWQTLK